MKKLIIPCITLILTFILAISVSAESLPALHPAEKLKTGFSAAYITEHYNICEISHATGETAFGEELNVVSYRLQPKDTQNETLLLIDEVQDASSGETLYFTLHYGNFGTGEVTRAEVIYP